MKGFLNKVKGSVGGDKKEDAKTEKAPDTTPRADVILPKGVAKRRGSMAKQQRAQVVLKELPLLVETPMQKREVSSSNYCVYLQILSKLFYFVITGSIQTKTPALSNNF